MMRNEKHENALLYGINKNKFLFRFEFSLFIVSFVCASLLSLDIFAFIISTLFIPGTLCYK